MKNLQLQKDLRHLLKNGTSCIRKSDINNIADLRFFKAVYLMPKIKTSPDHIIIGLSKKRGSKAIVKQFINTGQVMLV